MISTTSRSHRLRLAAVLGLLAGVAATAMAADEEVVILKDGFALQGKLRKEMTMVNDPHVGPLAVPKDSGFDLLDEGPKVVIFSTHAKQVGEINKEIKLRPEYKAYKMPWYGRKSNYPLPSDASTKGTTDYNSKWVRTIEVRVPNGWEKIEQQISHIDPFYTYMVSPTHLWRCAYRTNEFEPAKVRKLLSYHPDIAEPDGKPNALKRLALAKFMLDIGWLKLAKDDLETIQKLFPNGVPKDAKEAYDKLVKEIDAATAALVVKESELALGAGRYNYASELLAAFPEKLADPKQIDDATKMMAQLKATRERYETGRRLLRTLLDEVTGQNRAIQSLAVGGGLVGVVWPAKQLPTPLDHLVDAAEKVYAEMHPDSAFRIETFINLTSQYEREKLQGRDPTKKPDELLATLISGWAKGRNGATEQPVRALKLWGARETVLGFQRAPGLNQRNEILRAFKKDQPVGVDDLAQIITLLPPADPEDLNFRVGTPVKPRPGSNVTGIYKRVSTPTAEHPRGVPYFIKLPPEYHHGRPYPVMMVLTSPNIDADEVLGSLAYEADRHGYILIAPDWADRFGNGWQWDGDDHWYVLACLREAVRHFCVDNDRVFLFGIGDGANMAMDIGSSHPDLFAGIVAMGPNLRGANSTIFSGYWRNAQKLPHYIVTGEQDATAMKNIKEVLFKLWMPPGFPAIDVIYKGRGSEWFAGETPVIFDWMGRKKRVSGTATLQLNQGGRYPWMTVRSTDNRFYWLGIEKIHDRHLIENKGNKSRLVPAEIQGDIRGNNEIYITSRGVMRLSILLTPELIDWSKPVPVTINGSTPAGYHSKILEPDIDLMLEDYRIRGDRRVLILGKLEFNAVP